MKQLLIDYTLFNVTPELISESQKSNGGKVIVSGVLQRAEAQNQNGRVYPKNILEREVEKYLNREVAERRALGELDHPDSNVVNLKNVSHNIRNVWWNGDDVMGEVEILPTPSGNILKELLKSGVTIGISSRGMGSVRQMSESHCVMVQDDFELICWDFVSNPSTHGAFMRPTGVNESVSQPQPDRYNRVNTLVSDILCELSCKCSLPQKSK